MKRWIEARVGWLLGQFGETKVLSSPMILPNHEFYPDVYDESEEAGRRLFARTCEYMHFDPARVELKFYRPERTGRFNASLVQPRPGWAGLYDADEESQKTIWIDSELLEDAIGLVATFAHELSHAILLGEKRLPRDLPDMEPITDLATVVLGMGIFNANVSLRTNNYTATLRNYSSISRIGYLTPEIYGYALALFAWLREEEKPAWSRYLGTSLRDPFKQGLGYLQKTRDASIDAGESLDSISSSELFLQTASKSQSQVEDDMKLEAEFQAAVESETEADGQFADGYICAENGQWEEAVEVFSQVLEEDPEDGETYQERAWAYLELDRIAEAVADAEKAVMLLPEEAGAYLVRGAAYLQSKRYGQAISDLDQYMQDDYRARTEISTSKACYFRGLAYAGQCDFKKALRDLSKAIIYWPKWPDPYDASADVYERLGEFEKASKDREEAVYRAQE